MAAVCTHNVHEAACARKFLRSQLCGFLLLGRDGYVLNDKSLLVITDQRKPETSAMSQHFSSR